MYHPRADVVRAAAIGPRGRSRVFPRGTVCRRRYIPHNSGAVADIVRPKFLPIGDFKVLTTSPIRRFLARDGQESRIAIMPLAWRYSACALYGAAPYS